MLHSITQSVMFDIDESEAEKLAGAIQKVTRHYDVPQMAQTTVDWVMLIQACGAIYGPRLMAVRMERNALKAKNVPQHRSAPANVAPAPTAPNQPQQPSPPAAPAMQARTTPPPNIMSAPQPAPLRRQPGLEDLDGSNLPLKPN